MNFVAKIDATRDPAKPTVYTQAKVKKMVVTIRGEALTPPAPSPLEPSPYADTPFRRNVRFASTNFYDGTALPIVVSGELELSNADGSRKAVVTVSEPKTITVTTYNKVLCLSSKDDPGGHKKATANIGRSPYAASHGADPGFLDEPYFTKQAFLAELLVGTVMWGSTHGNQSFYADSDWTQTWQQSHPQDTSRLISPQETGIAAYGGIRTAPPYNLSVMYSCGLLSSETDTRWGQAFGVIGPYGTLDDRAFCGFTVILPDGWENTDGQNVSVEQHALLVFANLKQGMSAKDAILDANN